MWKKSVTNRKKKGQRQEIKQMQNVNGESEEQALSLFPNVLQALMETK